MGLHDVVYPVPNPVVRFGVFEADERSGELRKNGVKVRIQDLPFRALILLLSRPNDVITREEFRQTLWPNDVFVDFDGAISGAIKRLRYALGDSADSPVFIETVDRRGYRWIAPTHVPAPVAPTVPAEVVPMPSRSSSSRWIAFALPALALVFAAWLARPVYRSAKAGSKNPVNASLVGKGTLPRPAANREAEDFYLSGRFYWNKRTPESLSKAVDAFTQSIVHDPNYAPAYVGLADCYNLMPEYTVMPRSEASPRAYAAAKKAVELDDQSSEAHASLAFVSFWGMWKVADADRNFRRAIDLNPNNSIAHHWYATYLMAIRRFPEALVEIDRARTLDPDSSSIIADKGAMLASAGRPEEAVTLLKQLAENEPGSVSAHRYLRFIYMDTGDYGDYLIEYKKEADLTHDSLALAMIEELEKAYTKGGRQMMETLFREQKKLYEKGALTPYSLAETSALLGRNAEALQYLNLAYKEHQDRVIEIAGDPAFAGLHDLPGFQELLEEVGLPPIH